MEVYYHCRTSQLSFSKVFSALAGGLLTGKYNKGIPENSRFTNHNDLSFIKEVSDSLTQEEWVLRLHLGDNLSSVTFRGKAKIATIVALTEFAEKGWAHMSSKAAACLSKYRRTRVQSGTFGSCMGGCTTTN
jgi:hypothetical protein